MKNLLVICPIFGALLVGIAGALSNGYYREIYGFPLFVGGMILVLVSSVSILLSVNPDQPYLLSDLSPGDIYEVECVSPQTDGNDHLINALLRFPNGKVRHCKLPEDPPKRGVLVQKGNALKLVSVD